MTNYGKCYMDGTDTKSVGRVFLSRYCGNVGLTMMPPGEMYDVDYIGFVDVHASPAFPCTISESYEYIKNAAHDYLVAQGLIKDVGEGEIELIKK